MLDTDILRYEISTRSGLPRGQHLWFPQGYTARVGTRAVLMGPNHGTGRRSDTAADQAT